VISVNTKDQFGMAMNAQSMPIACLAIRQKDRLLRTRQKISPILKSKMQSTAYKETTASIEE
jgi:hypothetical protein